MPDHDAGGARWKLSVSHRGTDALVKRKRTSNGSLHRLGETMLRPVFLCVAFVTSTAILATAQRALAFKQKTHVYTANIAIEDLRDGSAYFPGVTKLHRFNQSDALSVTADPPLEPFATICEEVLECRADVPGKEIDLINDDLVYAINHYPRYVRAGTVGPDGFPDLIWGQQSAHVNRTPKTLNPNLPFECRDPNNPFTWRSIDYGQYFLNAVLRSCTARSAGLCTAPLDYHSSLAFAYGYLLHMAGDAFAHSHVNQQVGGVFEIGHGDGAFGPLTEEVKHFAYEGYIDSKFTFRVFEDDNYTGLTAGAPASGSDPRMPGNNAVVYPHLVSTPFECPPIPRERWHYCNPFRDQTGMATTAPDFSKCANAPERPSDPCDPWREVCHTGEISAGFDRAAKRIRACPPAKKKPGFIWDDTSVVDPFDLSSDICGLRALLVAGALRPLPTTCNSSTVIEDPVTGRVANECILINCTASDPGDGENPACPEFGIQGVRDPLTEIECEQAPTSADADAIAARLQDTSIRAPIAFLAKTMLSTAALSDVIPAQPTDGGRHYYPRSLALAGPHLQQVMVMRDRLRRMAHDLRFVTLSLPDLLDVIAEESDLPPYLENAIGALTVPLTILAESAGVLTCAATFGLFCPDTSPPILSPSTILLDRAAGLNAKLYRWFELSECVQENLIRRAQADEHDETRGVAVTDSCLRFDWYKKWKQGDLVESYWTEIVEPLADELANPDATPSALESCFEGTALPDAPDDVPMPESDPGTVGFALTTMGSVFVDKFVVETFSISAADVGVDEGFLQAATIAIDYLMHVTIGETTATLKARAIGYACEKYLARSFKEFSQLAKAYETLELFKSKPPGTLVNFAFLVDDMNRDAEYSTAVAATLSDVDRYFLQCSGPRPEGACCWNGCASDQRIERLQSIALSLIAAGDFLANSKGPKLREVEQLLHVEDDGDLIVDRFPPLFNTVQLNKLAALGRGAVTAIAEAGSSVPIEDIDGRTAMECNLRNYAYVASAEPSTRDHFSNGPSDSTTELVQAGTAANRIFDMILDYEGYDAWFIGDAASREAARLRCDDVRFHQREKSGRCPMTNNNLMCDAIPSLDDPDNAEHNTRQRERMLARCDADEPLIRGSAPTEIGGELSQPHHPLRSVVLDRALDEPSSGAKTLTYATTNFPLLARGDSETGESHNMPRLYSNIMSPYYCHPHAGALPVDTDGDLVPDDCDNCPADSNPGQQDFNADALGDACDTIKPSCSSPSPDCRCDMAVTSRPPSKVAVIGSFLWLALAARRRRGRPRA